MRLNSATWYNCNKKPIYAQWLLKSCYTMPEYGRCKINTSDRGKVWKQHLRASASSSFVIAWLSSIAANCEPELKLIKSPSNGESQPWLRNYHSNHGAEVPYSPNQMSTYLLVYTMKSRFCRVSKPSFSSVSHFLSITVNRNLIESPSKGKSQPQLRSIYHSYHGAEVYMDFRRTRSRCLGSRASKIHKCTSAPWYN